MAVRALLAVNACVLLTGCLSRLSEDANQWYSSADRPLENHAGVYYYGNQTFTGRIYELSGKDTLYTAGFLKGREHGEWRRFYAGGRLAESRFFSNGEKTGVLRSWWENGQPKIEYRFANNEYEGLSREWNRAGALVAEHHYHAGHEAGEQRSWYDNGKIRANYVITGGRRYGLLGTKNCVNVSDSVFKK